MSGTLFVVATPIGNLEDLSPRVRQTLAEVSLVAAEDTRRTGRLLMHIGCKTRLMALHDHNESQVVGDVIRILMDGESVALLSDAGTPLVSDPGYRLLNEAHANGIPVSPIPGPSAVTAALSVAGIATDRFCFEGFPPAKRAARKQWLKNLALETRTLVIFEAVHRIAACVEDMVEVFGADREAFVGRELSKLHEQCVRDSLGAISRLVHDEVIVSKGEFVIVLSGAPESPGSSIDVDRLLRALGDRLSAKDAAKVAAEATGLKRNALYERLHTLKATD